MFEKLTEEEKKKVFDKLLVEWTYHSTGIEGNTLTLSETVQVAMFNLGVAGKPIKDINEVVNHKEALSMVFDWVFKQKVNELTHDDIFTICQKLMKSELPYGVKTYRDGDIGVYRYVDYDANKKDNKNEFMYFSPPAEIPNLMNRWIAKLNQNLNANLNEVDAIKTFTLLHNEFVSIHPFYDGNGRMVRLLCNTMMMSNNLSPIVIKRDNRFDYVTALSQMNDRYAPPNSCDSVLLLEDCTESWQLYQKIYQQDKEELLHILKPVL